LAVPQRFETDLDRDEVAFRFVARRSGGALPRVPMMETADARQRDDDTRDVRALFHWPRSRWVLPERQVRAVFVVVADVGANESAQMSLIDHDHVMEHVAT
jgi:hypothetical protein